MKKLRTLLLPLALIGLIGCTYKKTENKIISPEIILEHNIKSFIIIPITIKNKKYRFLVDTGASVNVINKKIAAEISTPYLLSDLHSSYQKFFSEVKSVSGAIDKDKYIFLKPQPFFIGTQEISDEDVWLSMDLSLFIEAIGVDIDGVIGIETFRKFSWQVDNIKKRLIVTKDAPSTHNYQTCDGYMDTLNSMPTLWLKYNDIDDIAFMIDTGADYGSIADNFIHYLKNKSHLQSVSNQPEVDARGIHLESPGFILSGLIYNDMHVGEIRVGENNNQKYTMGMDFLSRFNRYTFIPSRMMFCYDAQSIQHNNILPIRNIAIRYINNHIEVFYNTNTVLIGTGLKNGDIILNANGQYYAPEQIGDLRTVLSDTPKAALELTIQRGTQKLVLQI